MKRVFGIGIILALLLLCCFPLMAGAASVIVLASEDETAVEPQAGEEEAPNTAQQEAQPVADPDGNPEIRWTYTVSLGELYSPFNRIVNRDYPLEENFEPQELVKMTVKRATSAAVYLDRTAAIALERMFDAASEAGYTLYLKSGYRSFGTQKTTYANHLANNNGKDNGVVAPPGSSEHQTGWACDILNEDYAGRPRMTLDFSETAEAQWMKENCADFGFILRYPDDKTDITKIIFEPWHFRYVGREVAGYLMHTQLTMEEFYTEWHAAVADFQSRGGDVDAWIAYEAQRALNGPETFFLDVYGDDGDREVSLVF